MSAASAPAANDPSSEPCQEWLKVEATLPEPSTSDDVSILRQDFRISLDNMRKLAHNPHKIVPNGSRTVTARDGRRIPIRIYSPPGHPYHATASTPSSPATATSPPPLTKEISEPITKPAAPTSSLGAPPPLVIYFHGGGWSTGDPDFGINECIHFASNGALVVAADYRKAPENTFPVPVNDCQDAFEAILSPDSKLNLNYDNDRVYLAGASAGAHLCITTTILDILSAEKSGRSGTRIKGLLLQAPVCCHPKVFNEDGSYPNSYIAHAGSPILGRMSLERFWKFFVHGDNARGKESPTITTIGGKTTHIQPHRAEVDLKQPLLSPLFCSEDVLKKFPKVHMGVYGIDPLKDEAKALAVKLEKAGVEVKVDVYYGWPHCAFMFFPNTEGAKKSFEGIDEAAKWMGLY